MLIGSNWAQEKQSRVVALLDTAPTAPASITGCPGLRVDVAWREKGIIESTDKVYKEYSMRIENEIGSFFFSYYTTSCSTLLFCSGFVSVDGALRSSTCFRQSFLNKQCPRCQALRRIILNRMKSSFSPTSPFNSRSLSKSQELISYLRKEILQLKLDMLRKETGLPGLLNKIQNHSPSFTKSFAYEKFYLLAKAADSGKNLIVLVSQFANLF